MTNLQKNAIKTYLDVKQASEPKPALLPRLKVLIPLGFNDYLKLAENKYSYKA